MEQVEIHAIRFPLSLLEHSRICLSESATVAGKMAGGEAQAAGSGSMAVQQALCLCPFLRWEAVVVIAFSCPHQCKLVGYSALGLTRSTAGARLV